MTKFKSNGLMLDMDVSLTFNYPVQEVLEVGEIVVVLLDSLGTKQPLPGVNANINAAKSRNVFGISKVDGNVLWQIATTNDANKELDNPYVGMGMNKDGSLSVGSWAGIVVTLAPLTGREVAQQRWVK